MLRNPGLSLIGAAALMAATAVSPAGAQTNDVADFYRGKTVSLIVGFVAGASMDAAARTLATHWAKHIPGQPRIIVRNMPGAGGLVAANHIFNSAAKDGTIIGMFGEAITIAPLMRQPGANYDARTINWIGSPTSRPTAIALFRRDAPAKTLEEAMKTELLVGSTGTNSPSYIYPRLMNDLFGTKFKIILGYKGGPEVDLAIERGELHGKLGYSWLSLNKEHPNWVKNNFIVIMSQLSLKADPAMPGVPMITSLARTEEQKQLLQLILGVQEISRPFAMAPGVPPARVAAIRAAFDASMKDPAFVEEAKKRMADPLDVRDWRYIEQFVQGAHATPKNIVERATRIMGGK